MILVSKDVNLRIKAKSLGLPAEDYTTGKVRHVDRLYSGTACWEGLSSEMITRLHHEPHTVPMADLAGRGALLPNQYLVMKNGSLSALAHHNRPAGTLERVTKRAAYGVEPRNAEQIFALDALLRPEVQLVTMTGHAGTGKTLLALAAALEKRRRTSRSTSRAPSCRSPTATSASCPATSRASSTPTCSRCSTTSR